VDEASRRDSLRPGGRLRSSRWVFIAVVVVLVGGCAGSADERRTSPPAPVPSSSSPSSAATGSSTKGGFAKLSDRQLAYACHNVTPKSPRPTVVLLTGLDNDMQVWDSTISRLGDTPVCTYDRANNGGSDILDGPRPIDDSVKELSGFLEAAGVPGPYILVGHSYGGLIGMLYAAEQPGDVLALVLVDALLPFEDELDAMVYEPDELKKVRREQNISRENIAIYGHLPDSKDLARSLPPIPTVYLFGAKQDLTEPGWPPGAYMTRMNDFIKALPKGSITEVNAGHGIPVEDPDAIATQIKAITTPQ
jgi:pimeloyl-ACP methyl ester carboxylesterase